MVALCLLYHFSQRLPKHILFPTEQRHLSIVFHRIPERISFLIRSSKTYNICPLGSSESSKPRRKSPALEVREGTHSDGRDKKQLSQITGALYRARNGCGNLLSENVQVKRQRFADHIDPKEHISIDSAAKLEGSTDHLSVKRRHSGRKIVRDRAC